MVIIAKALVLGFLLLMECVAEPILEGIRDDSTERRHENVWSANPTDN